MFVVGFQDTGIIKLDKNYTVFDLDDFSMEDVSGLDLINYYDLLCDKYEFLNLVGNKEHTSYYMSHWQLSEILIKRASILNLKHFSLFQQSFNKIFIIINNDYVCFSCDRNGNIYINGDKIIENNEFGCINDSDVYIELRYIVYEYGYIVFHFNFYIGMGILEQDFKLYYKDNIFTLHSILELPTRGKCLNEELIALKSNFSKRRLLGDI